MRSEYELNDRPRASGVEAITGVKALLVLIGFVACGFAAAQEPEESIHAALDGLHESAAASEMDRYFGHCDPLLCIDLSPILVSGNPKSSII